MQNSALRKLINGFNFLELPGGSLGPLPLRARRETIHKKLVSENTSVSTYVATIDYTPVRVGVNQKERTPSPKKGASEESI